MKKVYLFTTRLIALWVLLPLAFLLTLCIKHNSELTGLFKLYPLILITSAAILFSIIFFYRAISISYSEIKQIGYFSSRDNAMITEGKTLILKKQKMGRVKIILFGNDGVLPGLDWMKNTYQAPQDIVLFRGMARGGNISIKRILKFFGADKSSISTLISNDGECKCEYTTITSMIEDGKRRIDIKIDVTV